MGISRSCVRFFTSFTSASKLSPEIEPLVMQILCTEPTLDLSQAFCLPWILCALDTAKLVGVASLSSTMLEMKCMFRSSLSLSLSLSLHVTYIYIHTYGQKVQLLTFCDLPYR
jgi:hypothetical protein